MTVQETRRSTIDQAGFAWYAEACCGVADRRCGVHASVLDIWLRSCHGVTFVRVNPVTVKNDVLDGHVQLGIDCLDRVYLHGYSASCSGWAGGEFLAPPRVPGVPSRVSASRVGEGSAGGRVLRAC